MGAPNKTLEQIRAESQDLGIRTLDIVLNKKGKSYLRIEDQARVILSASGNNAQRGAILYLAHYGLLDAIDWELNHGEFDPESAAALTEVAKGV